MKTRARRHGGIKQRLYYYYEVSFESEYPQRGLGSEACHSEHNDVGIPVSLSPPTPVFTCFNSYILIGEMSGLRLRPHQITHMLAASLRSSFLPGSSFILTLSLTPWGTASYPAWLLSLVSHSLPASCIWGLPYILYAPPFYQSLAYMKCLSWLCSLVHSNSGYRLRFNALHRGSRDSQLPGSSPDSWHPHPHLTWATSPISVSCLLSVHRASSW